MGFFRARYALPSHRLEANFLHLHQTPTPPNTNKNAHLRLNVATGLYSWAIRKHDDTHGDSAAVLSSAVHHFHKKETKDTRLPTDGLLAQRRTLSEAQGTYWAVRDSVHGGLKSSLTSALNLINSATSNGVAAVVWCGLYTCQVPTPPLSSLPPVLHLSLPLADTAMLRQYGCGSLPWGSV